MVSRRSTTTCSPPAWSWAFDAKTTHDRDSNSVDGRIAMPTMIRKLRWVALGTLLLAPARSMAAPADAADVARLQGEVDRLKQDLASQRQLILQLMQAEQQRYDV